MKHLVIAILFTVLAAQGANAQGTRVCFGDGVDNFCPCGNDNDSSGSLGNEAGCANSAGLAGCTLDAASGTNSVSADDLVLCFEGAPAGVPGILYAGTLSLTSPFGDGIRCCGGNIRRLEVIFTDSSGAGCNTVPIASTSGQTVGDIGCYQYWYRDPSGPCGSGFNLSNAYEVVWTL